MKRYLAELQAPKITLWCYLCWYFAIVFQYFDCALNLWLSSVGIAVLIGIALNIAASQRGQTRDKWVVIRLYIFPFCVSSYSALIKGQGFFLLFPTQMKPLLIGVGACAAFIVIVLLAKLTTNHSIAEQRVDPNA